MGPELEASLGHRGITPALQMKRPRSERHNARRSHDKDRAGLGFQSSLLELLEKKKSLPVSPGPHSHAHRHKDPHVPSTGQVPSPSLACGPTQRLVFRTTGRGRAAREATERARAWVGGHVHCQPVPGCAQPKLGA